MSARDLLKKAARAALLRLHKTPPPEAPRMPAPGERWQWAPAEANLAPEARGFCYAEVLHVRHGLVLYRLGPGSLFPRNVLSLPLFVSLYAPTSGPIAAIGGAPARKAVSE